MAKVSIKSYKRKDGTTVKASSRNVKKKKISLGNHLKTGAKLGAGLGGALGALQGGAIGATLGGPVGAVIGATSGGLSGAAGTSLTGTGVGAATYAARKKISEK